MNDNISRFSSKVTVATYQKKQLPFNSCNHLGLHQAPTEWRLNEKRRLVGWPMWKTSVVIDQVSWWANVRGVNSDIQVWIANHFWKFVLIEVQANKVAINCTDFIQNIYRPAVILSNVPPALPFQELPIVRGMRYDHKFGRVKLFHWAVRILPWFW